MMNRILVEKDKISKNNYQNIKIKDNKIVFTKSGEYTIEYVDCKNISLDITINDNIMIKLYEFSNQENFKLNNT